MTQTYKYPEGDVYEGDWSKEGKKHGIGRIAFTDGSSYEGRFMNGFFSGYGTLRLADGTLYTGEFSDGLFHGFGVYVRFDGTQYEGEFKEGTPNGPGLVTFPNGSNGKPKQEGYFEGSKLRSRQSVTQFVRRAQASRDRALNTTLGNAVINE